jgi:hypothetical protein
MPCFCYIDDQYIEPELKIIRAHMRIIIEQAKILHSKGDLSPLSGSKPRHILDDIHKLLDDLWNGECQEEKDLYKHKN